MYSYKNYEVWQKSMDLVVLIYQLSDTFPKTEQFNLTSQVKRSAAAIPANIAEGKLRGTDPEFKRFLLIAFASGGELETHLEIAKRLGYVSEKELQEIIELLTSVMKMLNVLIRKIKANGELPKANG